MGEQTAAILVGQARSFVYSIGGVIAARSRAVENHSLKFLPGPLGAFDASRYYAVARTQPFDLSGIRGPITNEICEYAIFTNVTMFNLTTMHRPTFPVDV